MRTVAVGIVLLVALAGCTTLAPGAKDVYITRNAVEVQQCKALGSVQSVPPYVLPNDDLKQLRNQTIAVGADTVLITGPRLVSTAGVAYRCHT